MSEENVVEAKPKPKKKSPLLLLVLVLLIVGGSVGGMMVVKGKKTKKPEEPKPPKMGEVVSLDEILVNLEDGHYLRLTVALGMSEGHNAEEMKEVAPEVRHAIIMTLCDKKMEELMSHEGKHHLAEELLKACNKALERHAKKGVPPVLEIFFSNFAMQ